MNAAKLLWIVSGLALLTPAAYSQNEPVNRLSLSARVGLNISARFVGDASDLPPLARPNPRTAPRGEPYNYDNGYVLTDASDNFGDLTSYWGYDDSSRQISGDNILMSRTGPADFNGPDELGHPSGGLELTYNRWLGEWRRINYGLELAANWQSISFRDSGTFMARARRITDAYPFTPGTTPPTATPGNPYQGGFDEGFLIGDTPSRSTAIVPDGMAIVGTREFDADLWGFRLGPYFEVPLSDKLNFSLSGGLTVGLLNSRASWDETIIVGSRRGMDHGSGTDFGVLWGGYAAANLRWELDGRWSLNGGVQYQNLGKYDADFGARDVELSLRDNIFLILGASYTF